MKRIYAGIGSRETPPSVCAEMTAIAEQLDLLGFTLRSGGADGADAAFENGVLLEAPQIFLPWKGFNNRKGLLVPDSSSLDAAKIASKFHPNWERLTYGARKLHTRNVAQVLGADLKTPCDFIVCWTKDGKASGGTGQALRIATAYDVKIYNLFNQTDRKDLCTLMETLK